MTNLIRIAREIINISQVFHYHINNFLTHNATNFKLDTFTQIWGSTSAGFEGIGGQMMTEQKTYIFTPLVEGEDYMVFFGGRYAYSVSPDNKKFQEDLKHGNIAGQYTAIKRYGKSCHQYKNAFAKGVDITSLLQMAQEILSIKEDFPNHLNDFKKYNESDFELIYFMQTWNDISGGFEQSEEKALTTQRTYVFSPMIDEEDYMIFFGGRYAYSVASNNKKFEEDLKNSNIAGRYSAIEKYGDSYHRL